MYKRQNKTDTVFHLLIHPGKDDDPSLGFTIPHDMTKPSATSSGGAPEFKAYIAGGVATLSNYPEKDIRSFSYNDTYPEKSPVIPNAIVITSSEKQGEEARIITGNFNFKTYRDNKETESYVIKGKFRIKHKLSNGVM